MSRPVSTSCFLVLWSLAGGCGLLGGPLPEEPPALADLEQPLDLAREPDDETARLRLPAGSFTGVVVADARASLEDLSDAPPGLLVRSVVENSPADAAEIFEGDLLLRASREGAPALNLRWQSEWRQLELEAAPGKPISIDLERAGITKTVVLVPTPRVRPGPRASSERLSETTRIGVVLRTATQVEASAAGLPPGGGAVVVGLARESPWRRAGLHFGDLLITVAGRQVAHPQVVLDAIRAADDASSLALALRRDGALLTISAPVSRRNSAVREIAIPLLFHYEHRPERTETSLLLGLFGHASTKAAWEVRLLWILRFGGGDTERLHEIDQPRKEDERGR